MGRGSRAAGREPGAATAYVPRLLDAVLTELLATFPAISITGARATGKTTTARRLAADELRLDRPAEALAAGADPDAVLRTLGRPALLDEWQAVEDVLGAVKRAVDEDPRPGQWLLTGSVRAALDASAWPGTGRVLGIRMEPMTLAERHGRALDPFVLDGLWEDGGASLVGGRSELDLDGYVRELLRGGFPALLHLDAAASPRWLASYVEQVVTRDASQLDSRDPERLRRYLRANAAVTGTVAEHKTMYDAAGIDRRTASAYDDLLVALGISAPIPAWATNELKRLTRAPKRHLADPALAVPLLGVDQTSVLRDGERQGRLFETFVALHLRALAAAARTPSALYHLRTDGREIDVVLERPDRRVIAIEVKAKAAVTARDAASLRWLREQLGDQVAAALIIHTGPRAFRIDPDIIAVPLAVLA